ncbi:DUF4350 domain-containing protein [Sphingomonas psychrolutea]|uniref:DUF4350 domain-containing protein n=1 Tax=Sphingomonas psychrolutea TaxID=1259676 RepID=A0ABQ1H0E7_9SPHN|nr:DUF4350 domain-containing protein [Sphingomonas psychrolutea]GGA53705.1 hypothetical protein GCM10011395_25140 [Sphingomonas psychrolutea]
MSDVAIGAPSGARAGGAFTTRTVAILVAVGILTFVGMLVLGAYAPDLRSGRNGGAHALSNAAIGYSGIVRLAEATGHNPQIVRDPRKLATEDLVVLTPEAAATDMTKMIEVRQGKPTLVILPKWETAADQFHPGWVRFVDLKSTSEPDGVLAPKNVLKTRRYSSGGRPLLGVSWMPATIRFRGPKPVQTISGPDLTPLITDDQGHIVLAQIGEHPFYVLADPDLLSNIGMRDAGQARAALDLLDFLNATGAKSIAFDVTLNGFGHGPSPLKLAFDPPFLAMTLAIAIAVLLAGIQATARFGVTQRRARAIAFGKTALIDNTAALVRKAGRHGALGPRYLDLVRERARTVLGVPSRLRDQAYDAYLDRLGGRARFSELAEQARVATDPRAMLQAAQALHHWLWEKSR